MDECEYCFQPMDGHKTRWLCPRCGMKNSCCNGSPLPPHKGPSCEGPKAGTEGTS